MSAESASAPRGTGDGPHVLVIDHHDSFVHNLVRYVTLAGGRPTTIRCDALGLDDAIARDPDGVLLSPGPRGPADTPLAKKLVNHRWSVPIFGVCLGHQSIAAAIGAVVRPGPPMHGMGDEIEHDASGLLAGCPSPMKVGRYHSLHVDEKSLPDHWTVTARSRSDGGVMGLRSDDGRIESVQFHPESILTPHGHRIVENFVVSCRSVIA